MRKMIIAALITVSLSGCGNTTTAHYDSSDPLNCFVIYGITANAAKAAGKSKVYDEAIKRAALIATKSGGLEWLSRNSEKAKFLSQEMQEEKNIHSALQLVDACIVEHDTIGK